MDKLCAMLGMIFVSQGEAAEVAVRVADGGATEVAFEDGHSTVDRPDRACGDDLSCGLPCWLEGFRLGPSSRLLLQASHLEVNKQRSSDSLH